MRRVKRRDTAPEVAVRRLLHRMGYRFRLHRSDMPGRPDIVLPRHHKVILVHGCFWHGHEGCPRAARPTSNAEFWNRKLAGNIERDARVRRQLEESGWKVLTLWQCQVRDAEKLQALLDSFISDRSERVPESYRKL
jgi:DNA mismatch endonuclease (patch repair protein)